MTSSKKKNSNPEKGGMLSDIAKKLFLTGLGAVFMTEESIRGKIAELKLPKEAVGYVFDQAKKQKDDLISVIANEVSKFFAKIKVHEEIQKALSAMQMHIDARISFLSKGKQSDHIKITLEDPTDKNK